MFKVDITRRIARRTISFYKRPIQTGEKNETNQANYCPNRLKPKYNSSRG